MEKTRQKRSNRRKETKNEGVFMQNMKLIWEATRLHTKSMEIYKQTQVQKLQESYSMNGDVSSI